MPKPQTRRSKRKSPPKSSSVVDDEVQSDPPLNKQSKKVQCSDQSGSESSSDEFVRPAKALKVNLVGPHLRNGPSPVPDFASIEESIFSGVSKLSDSESNESDFEEVPNTLPISASLGVQKEEEGKSLKQNKVDPKTKSFLPEKSESTESSPRVKKSRGRTKNVVQESVKDESGNDNKSEVSKDVSDIKNNVRTTRSSKRKSQKEPEVTVTPAKRIKNEDGQEKNASETNPMSSLTSSPYFQTEKQGQRNKVKNMRVKKEEVDDKHGTSKQEHEKSKVKKERNTSVVNALGHDVDNLDIAQLLALGEGLKAEMQSQEHSDSDSEGWEEVGASDSKEPEISKDGVQITLDAPKLSFRCRKDIDKRERMQAEMIRIQNRLQRELQILIHKTSLLLWLAHGIFLNTVLGSQKILATALSLIPVELIDHPAKSDRKYVIQLLNWFVHDFESSEGFPELGYGSKTRSLTDSLEQHFSRKYATSNKELTFMFVSVLRAVHVESRLVLSFLPAPLKPPSISSAVKKKEKLSEKRCKDNSESVDDPAPLNGKPVGKSKSPVSKPNLKSLSKPVTIITHALSSQKCVKWTVVKSPLKTQGPRSKASAVSKSAAIQSPLKTRGQRNKESKKSYAEKTDTDEDSSEDGQPILSPNKKKSDKDTSERLRAAAAKRAPSNRRFSLKSTAPKNKEQASAQDSDDSDFQPKPKRNSRKESSDLQSKSKQNSGARHSQSSVSPQKPATSRRSRSQKSDSDSDFESKPKANKSLKPVGKKSPVKGQPRKGRPSKCKGKGTEVFSSDDDKDTEHLRSSAFNYWVEIYLKDEQRWVCVDVASNKVDQIKEILAKATQPVVYVVGFNENGTVKDVTKRYTPKFSQVTKKLRVSDAWWKETLDRFAPERTAKDTEEDAELNLVELDTPMPKTVGECKDHPLYALQRHLLKFQAIYPPDAPTLGFVRKEPIFARQNVYTLHSREIWMKEAKIVRLGEVPYKIVKARPKYDKLSGKVITDLPLEVFGPWQVEDYVPPPAVNGVIPRNAYGNVELFKPTMLPKGTVHLHAPGLSRVAKKLGFDCAPAVVGFDYHSGGCHPTFDGFVVCEEHAETLLDAWNKDIDESAKRHEEQREKRIYGNWRKLIRGLIIREQLKFRYNFEGADEEEAGSSQLCVNPGAMEASRITTKVEPLPCLFPKLMANLSAKKSRQKKSTTQQKKNVKRVTTPKAPPRRRKRQVETSEEETSEEETSEEEEEEEEEDELDLSEDDD